MENPPLVEEITVRYGDLNPYGHVSNTNHLAYFEAARIAYWRRLAREVGLGPLEAGDIPGVRYVIAETTIRYKAPIFLEDALFAAASIRSISSRSFVIDYELRAGESFDSGRTAAEGTAVHVFYDLETGKVRPRPDWFLPAVAAIEGRHEESFAPPPREAG